MSNKKKCDQICVSTATTHPPLELSPVLLLQCPSVYGCVLMCVYMNTETKQKYRAWHNTSEWCTWKSAGEMKGGYDDECLSVWFLCTSRGVLKWVCVAKCTINSSIYVRASARISCVMVYVGGRIGLRHRCSELRSFGLPAVVMRMMIMTLLMMMIHYEGSQELNKLKKEHQEKGEKKNKWTSGCGTE